MSILFLTQPLYQDPVSSSWPYKSHSSKSYFTFLEYPIPIKIVIYVSQPIAKNLRIINTIECRRIYLNPTNNFIIVIARYVDAFIPPTIAALLILWPPVVSSLWLFSNLSILCWLSYISSLMDYTSLNKRSNFSFNWLSFSSISNWLGLHLLQQRSSMHQYETQMQGNQIHRWTIPLGVD